MNQPLPKKGQYRVGRCVFPCLQTLYAAVAMGLIVYPSRRIHVFTKKE